MNVHWQVPISVDDIYPSAIDTERGLAFFISPNYRELIVLSNSSFSIPVESTFINRDLCFKHRTGSTVSIAFTNSLLYISKSVRIDAVNIARIHNKTYLVLFLVCYSDTAGEELYASQAVILDVTARNKPRFVMEFRCADYTLYKPKGIVRGAICSDENHIYISDFDNYINAVSFKENESPVVCSVINSGMICAANGWLMVANQNGLYVYDALENNFQNEFSHTPGYYLNRPLCAPRMIYEDNRNYLYMNVYTENAALIPSEQPINNGIIIVDMNNPVLPVIETSIALDYDFNFLGIYKDLVFFQHGESKYPPCLTWFTYTSQ